MPWTASALIALVCFSAAFLAFGRLGQQMAAVPLVAWVLAIQAVPAFAHMLVTTPKTWMPPLPLLPLLLASCALCYAGNVAQMQALARAPNPGFALAIIGASTALVAVASALAFGAPLGLGKLAGIGLCLAGVVMVGISR